MRKSISWLFAVATFAAGPALAEVPSQSTKTIANSGHLGGAPYRIEIPANWNGDLVMLFHGYERKGAPRQSTWPQNKAAPVFLAKGYAVAESAYSTQGWAIAEAMADSEQLRRHFVKTLARPKHTYAVGFSMGGHLALATIERHPKAYGGALSLCGVNIPAERVFSDLVLTPLVVFDYYFPGVLPNLPAGLADPASPPMIDPAAVEHALASNEKLAQRLADGVDIRRGNLAGAIWLRYLALQEMRVRAGGFPADNRQTVYSGFGDDAALNRSVRRYAGDRKALVYVARNARLTGHISDPVVIQSNVDDPTVPARFGSIYPDLVRKNGQARMLKELPRLGHGHCDFTGEQIGAAFDALAREK